MMEYDSELVIDEFISTARIIFIVFIAFQIIAITLVRVKFINAMKSDILKTRGILNLIPDNFFETNRERVENVIKKLKD
jgi:hypothetical protein